MKRVFYLLVCVSGLLLTACGEENTSVSYKGGNSVDNSGSVDTNVCQAGEAKCEGSVLLTCGQDGQFVRTQCESQMCGKEGDSYRCLTPQPGHDCETEWSKCIGSVRYACNASFQWHEFEACASNGKVCKQNGNTASCEQESTSQQEEPVKPNPVVEDCTSGATKCDADGWLISCVMGRWNIAQCPGNQKCVVSGEPAVAGCVEEACTENCGSNTDPEMDKTGNASVNISITNSSPNAITLSPRFRFVLSTEGTGSEYPYNRTDSAFFAQGDSITINSGETKTFNKVEIPGDSKQYIGQHFARESELGGYANNVLLYDTEYVSETIVPEMIDPSTLFTDGGTYAIKYNPKTTTQPSQEQKPESGNASVNIIITNKSSSAITISPRFRFVLSTEGTGSQYPYNRTDAAEFAQSASITINGGETKTFNKVEIPGDSKQYIGQHFARKDELGTHVNNVLLYDTEYNSSTIVPQMIDPATKFTDGGTYTIIYESSNTTQPAQQPSSGNVSVNISITNKSSSAITLSPRFRFVLSTEGTGSEYPYNRTEAAIFAQGASITIGSGVTKSFNNVEIPENSKQYVGQHFARKDELGTHANNVLLYDTEYNSGTIVPQMIDPTTKFTDGGTYNIVYGSN